MNDCTDQAIAVLHTIHGLDIGRFDPSFLTRIISDRQAASGEDATAYVRRLREDRTEADALAKAMQINFSDFFRSSLAFGLLQEMILPGLVERLGATGRSELRIWSAGCAAGQEAWTIAMLLDDLGGGTGRTIPYRVFGTDVAAEALAEAVRGRYSAAAVQNVKLRHLQSHFVPDGDGYAIAPHLRRRVSFSPHDLLDESTASPPSAIFGDFDLVLCCNVLFYYRPGLRQIILRRLQRSLAPHGFLLTGEAERHLPEKAGGFQAVLPPAAVFSRKAAA